MHVIQEVIRRINAKYNTTDGWVKVFAGEAWEAGTEDGEIRWGDSMTDLSLFLEELRK